MSEKRFKQASWLGCVGLILTLLYLILIGMFLFSGQRHGLREIVNLPLNELGDFLAGVFGPLAIFWLVLGFFQQSRELRLQVRELSLSVEQQKELVGVTREALDHERSSLRSVEEKRLEALWPIFSFEFAPDIIPHTSSLSGILRMTNVGGNISAVVASVENSFLGEGEFVMDHWPKNKTRETRFSVAIQNVEINSLLNVRFLDADKNQCEIRFRFFRSSAKPFEISAKLIKRERFV